MATENNRESELPPRIDALLSEQVGMFMGEYDDPDLPDTKLIGTLLERRNAHAVLKLASMYRRGFLVGRDNQLAAWLYLAAAHLGHAGGARLLAMFYETGALGLRIDIQLSRKLYRWSSKLSSLNRARRDAFHGQPARIIPFAKRRPRLQTFLPES